MAKLFLTEQNRKKLAEIYKDLTGEDWVPPDMLGVPDIESLEKITKLIKEKPNYTIDKQGREG